MKAVAYLRTSTDDKGQDPQRQLDLIEAWAEREGVEVLSSFKDEGTSASKTNPFERPRFMGALQVAKDSGAALVVETPDRFTRQGSFEMGWAVVQLEREHGVSLLVADAPVQHQADIGGRIMSAIQAESARAWVERHSRAVRSGMQPIMDGKKATKSGRPIGRPPKNLSDEEKALARQLRDDGHGRRAIAHELNRRRGVFDIADPKVRRRRGVSDYLVRQALAGENSDRDETSSAPKKPTAGGKDYVSSRPRHAEGMEFGNRSTRGEPAGSPDGRPNDGERGA